MTHPLKNKLQAVVVYVVIGASEQTRGLHTVDPVAEFAVQVPSNPIIPVHPIAWV